MLSAPRLERAFMNYDIKVIAASPDLVRQQAAKVLDRPDKIGAIVSMAERLATEDWSSYRSRLTGQNHLDFMQSLPWIGGTNRYHLARNIGLDYAKPDRLMCRVAERFGYESNQGGVFAMVRDIKESTGEREGVIDIVLWRYEVEGRRLE